MVPCRSLNAHHVSATAYSALKKNEKLALAAMEYPRRRICAVKWSSCSVSARALVAGWAPNERMTS